jgi:hypothetical protein
MNSRTGLPRPGEYRFSIPYTTPLKKVTPAKTGASSGRPDDLYAPINGLNRDFALLLLKENVTARAGEKAQSEKI